jgi:hypothetical protein
MEHRIFDSSIPWELGYPLFLFLFAKRNILHSCTGVYSAHGAVQVYNSVQLWTSSPGISDAAINGLPFIAFSPSAVSCVLLTFFSFFFYFLFSEFLQLCKNRMPVASPDLMIQWIFNLETVAEYFRHPIKLIYILRFASSLNFLMICVSIHLKVIGRFSYCASLAEIRTGEAKSKNQIFLK